MYTTESSPYLFCIIFLVNAFIEIQSLDIENLILVGGESSKIQYEGLSVNSASEYITRDLNSGRFDFFCGGIAIPSRNIESEKLLRKGSNGVEFFTTQVLYDSKKIKKMLAICWGMQVAVTVAGGEVKRCQVGSHRGIAHNITINDDGLKPVSYTHLTLPTKA